MLASVLAEPFRAGTAGRESVAVRARGVLGSGPGESPVAVGRRERVPVPVSVDPDLDPTSVSVIRLPTADRGALLAGSRMPAAVTVLLARGSAVWVERASSLTER